MNSRLVAVFTTALLLGACGADTVVASISFDGDSCSSSDPADWPAGALDIVLTNNSDTRGAIILGTYNDGFGREDLIAYGSDISTRPSFIAALEIVEAVPDSTATVLFDPGPGTYFMVCMPAADTMVVLDDFTIMNQ